MAQFFQIHPANPQPRLIQRAVELLRDGAVIVYDAKTLEEIKRLPMRKPSGKYNVWNKVMFSDGTSH